MWLPTPLYERVPQFWLLLGLLFMITGLYLGFEYHMAFLYVGVGGACVLWSVAVIVWRHRYRTTPLSRTTAMSADGMPGQHDAEDAVNETSES
jgi:hypothetical protein